MASAVDSTNLSFRRWSPSLVEDLLFRRYIKKEDITTLLPQSPFPVAGSVTGSLTESYDRSAKMLFHYVRNGPLAALSPQNVNTANSTPRTKYGGTTYHVPLSVGDTKRKGTLSAARPPSPLPPSDGLQHRQVQKTAVCLPSPAAELIAAATVAAPLSAAKGMPAKKIRIEWPAEVPSNHSLCSSSRSKVQDLTKRRITAQENIDPDLIFKQNPGDLPLHEIFSAFPTAIAAINESRNASGDWRHDTFTHEEEEQYKKDCAYFYKGPSQCCASAADGSGNVVWVSRT